jgi:hypothetical protein
MARIAGGQFRSPPHGTRKPKRKERMQKENGDEDDAELDVITCRSGWSSV